MTFYAPDLSRHIRHFAFGAIAAALITAPLTAKAEETITSLSGEQLATMMRDWGYRAEVGIDDYGDPMISTAASGVDYEVFFYDCTGEKPSRCTSLMMSSGFILDEDLDLKVTNDWNLKNRYSRAYIDEEGDPILEYDVDLTGGITPAHLKEQFSTWENGLGMFTTEIGSR